MSRQRAKVARTSDFDGDGMKEVQVGPVKALLVHVNGQFHAMGATCPHQGAPLAEGGLHDGCVICPWHMSRFNAMTGEMVDPPTMDDLPRYEVEIDDTDIYVIADDEAGDRRTPAMTSPDPQQDSRLFVIIGGGAAGSIAAETLRHEGYRGRIVMITSDPGSTDAGVPYDRTNCSKDYLAGTAEPEWMPLRPGVFYQEHGIELVHQHVNRVDINTRRVELGDGSIMTPDAMLLATGGKPRSLGVPGEDLDNVSPLRTLADADAIIAAAQGDARRAVIIGASFIGMEAAASLTHRGVQVTVVAPEPVPFKHSLGEPVGEIVLKHHKTKGVAFHLGRTLRQISGNGVVQSVTLDDGTTLDADLVLIGVGVRPRTDFIQGAKLNEDGSVTVDDHLRLADGVWAAGDIAAFPNAHHDGQATRIEHWRLAQQHGRCAAANMAGRDVPFTGVPFFWTMHFDLALGYVGHARDWDELLMTGDPANDDFVAFYVKDGRPLAAAGTRSDQIIAFLELMRAGRLPSADAIRGQAHLDLAALPQ